MFKKSTTSTTGVTGGSRTNPLGALVISFALVLLVCCVVLFFALQGKFIVSKEPLPADPESGDVDYQFLIKVLDGFQVQVFEYARWHDDRSNLFSFFPNFDPSVSLISSNPQSGRKILAIRGKNGIEKEVLALVSYQRGEFRIIPKYSGSRKKESNFHSHKVVLAQLDTDPDLEVIEAFYIEGNDPARVWYKTRFDYDAVEQAYIQTTVTQEPSL